MESSSFSLDTKIKIEQNTSDSDEEPLIQNRSPELSSIEQKIHLDFKSTDAMIDIKSGQMVCLLCYKNFEQFSLMEHMIDVHNYRKVLFKCSNCSSTFQDRKQLTVHKDNCEVKVKKKKRLNLQQILLEVDSKEFLDDPEENVTCPVCMIDVSKYYLKEHLLAKHKKVDEEQSCSMCDRKYKSKSSLREHIKIVHESVENSEQCNVCKQKFRSVKYLQNHKRNVHQLGKKVHPCNICGKGFKSHICLFKHTKQVHTPCLPVKHTICIHLNDKHLKRSEEVRQILEMSVSETLCRACLSTGVKMHWIENTRLVEIYEILTNIELIQDGRSRTICYICYSQLLRCLRFSDMTRRSEKILRDLYHNSVEGSKAISPNLRTPHNLSITPVNTTCFNDTDFDFDLNDSYPDQIKDELDIKKEIVTGEEFPETASSFVEVQITDIFQNELENIESVDTSKYYCHVCSSRFSTQHKLVTHMRLHSNVSNSCKKCEEFICKCKTRHKSHKKTTKTQKRLKCKTESPKDTLGENPYTCNQCNKNFSDKACLIRHLRIHTGIKPYSCSRCKKTFIRDSDLKSHMRIHTGEKPYACSNCAKTFSMKHNLTRHIRTHTGEKPYSCTRCDKSFSEEGTLIVHTRIHTGEKPYSCDRCSKAFIRLSDLKTHLRIHTGEKPYACSVCSKTFSMKQHLNRHTRVHTGEKPYACDRCSKALASLGDLRSHMRVHTGEKPFACNICDKTFAVKQNLTRHTRIHTGEKPYACDRCSKAFTGSSDLKSHIRIHTGEKPFSCSRCEKCFTERSSLTKHMRIHVGKNPFKLE